MHQNNREMKKYLVFDTETTGLPQNWKGHFTDVNNWPRIIQFGFILFDEEGNDLFKFNELIKPDGWTIPKETFWIENGFSTEENIEKGVPIFDALRNFQDCLKQCDLKIGHNLNFDNNIVLAEMVRAKITHQLLQFKKGTCTMMKTTKIVKAPHANGRAGYKWPKLEELHQHLFECGFDNAHDAFADVTATKNCFLELVKRKYIIV